MQIPCPAQDLPDEKLWELGQSRGLASSSGDSGALGSTSAGEGSKRPLRASEFNKAICLHHSSQERVQEMEGISTALSSCGNEDHSNLLS